MTNFLEEAMEQGELREMTENLVEEAAVAVPVESRERALERSPVRKEEDGQFRGERAFEERAISPLKPVEEELGVPFDRGRSESGGPFLTARMAPQAPQEPPKGGRFDSPSLWNPSPNDQRAGAAAPTLWKPTQVAPRRDIYPHGLLRNAAGVGEAVLQMERAAAPGTRVRETVRRGEELPLLSAVRRAEESISFVRGQRRNFTVTAPETAGDGEGGLTVDALDRAVERDARRYGGSVFY